MKSNLKTKFSGSKAACAALGFLLQSLPLPLMADGPRPSMPDSCLKDYLNATDGKSQVASTEEMTVTTDLPTVQRGVRLLRTGAAVSLGGVGLMLTGLITNPAVSTVGGASYLSGMGLGLYGDSVKESGLEIQRFHILEDNHVMADLIQHAANDDAHGATIDTLYQWVIDSYRRAHANEPITAENLPSREKVLLAVKVLDQKRAFCSLPAKPLEKDQPATTTMTFSDASFLILDALGIAQAAKANGVTLYEGPAVAISPDEPLWVQENESAIDEDKWTTKNPNINLSFQPRPNPPAPNRATIGITTQ